MAIVIIILRVLSVVAQLYYRRDVKSVVAVDSINAGVERGGEICLRA